MKIAIPTNSGRLSSHFGHCEKFALVDVDAEQRVVLGVEYAEPPAHEPGALPKWLSEQGVQLVIAGGMGSRAQQLFQQFGIESIVGAPDGEARELAEDYLNGRLQLGGNACDH
jgi:ATP-binding protein involved in chromosome partitioning